MDLTWVIYVAIGLTALGIGVFVFLLFPGPRAASEPEVAGDVHPTLGRVQSASFGTSILAAAPRGYIGWLEKQVIFAGRPSSFVSSRRTSVWPSEPVPPVTRILLFSRGFTDSICRISSRQRPSCRSSISNPGVRILSRF